MISVSLAATSKSIFRLVTITRNLAVLFGSKEGKKLSRKFFVASQRPQAFKIFDMPKH